MIRTLLRHLRQLPGLLLLLLALGAARSAQATHLLGGELTYQYLNATGPSTAPLRYEITLKVYTTCAGSSILSSTQEIDIFNAATGARILNPQVTENMPLADCKFPYIQPGCSNGALQQIYFRIHTFVTIVNLPRSGAPQGFYAFWTDGARNSNITNLANSGGDNLTLYTIMAPPNYANHSPVFVNEAVGLLCLNDTTVLLNNATDADNDRLVYSYGSAYSVTTYSPTTLNPPLTSVVYANGYSGTYPLGGPPLTGSPVGNSAKIDPNTGISKFYATVNNAKYVVAIDVKEYRMVNGAEILIGTTRRDVQLVAGMCQPSATPVLVSGTGTTVNYTIEAGGTLTVPVTSTQSDGHPQDLTASSILLDGAGGTYDATFAGNPGTGSPVGSVTVNGPASPTTTPPTPSTVTGNFVFTPTCAQVRTQPYDVLIKVQDQGCGGKLVASSVRITVTKPTGPTAITGDAVICGLNTVHSYSKTGGTAPNVSWRIYPAIGGTLNTSTSNPTQITWTTAGTYTLTARGVGQFGCLTDSVSKTIQVFPAATITVTGNQSICLGQSTTLTVSGAAPYTVTDGTTTQTGNGPFTFTPTQTTVYTITGTSGAGAGCAPSTQATITVNPLPAANAGPAVSTCSGTPVSIGAAPVAGSTYQWSPATGLSSATAANPTVTLTNTTSAPVNTTYSLTETSAAGCTTTNSVVVTVNPLPTVVPGANLSICSGGSGTLGAAPVAGLTYSWSPATGLSSTTVANPTVTLTNTTSAPITTTYTLTVTGPGNCTNTGTVDVTVNPPATAPVGPNLTICSGGSGTLGAAPQAGYTYQWSPATGLSSATVANPTVTLTNTTSAPVTTTYTLTATANGCVSTGTVTVTVNPLPTAVAGANVAFCSGGSGTLGAAPVAGLTYSWSPATGLSSATAANPTVTLTNTTSAPVTTTYTLTVTGPGNCTGTGTVDVTVNPIPVAATGSNVAFCSGGSGTLGAAPVAGLTYQWSPATGLSSATVANPTVTLTNTTSAPVTTTYTLTVTGPGNCTGTGTVTVTVNPLPTAVAGANVAFCTGGSGTLGAAPVAGLTYQWSPATGLSSATVANPTVTLTNTTTAPVTTTYTLTVTGAGNCTNTATVDVTVNPLPTVVPGANVAFCSGGSGTLGAAPVAGNTYSWSPATGLSSTTVANPTVTLTNTTSAPVTTTYTLTVTNATNCTSTGTVDVTVNPIPVAVPGTNVTFCSGGSGTLGAAPVAGLTYSWSPATGLSSATAANPTVTLTNTTSAPVTTTYTLTVTGPGNCTSTGTVDVTVNPLPTVVPGANVAFCSGGSGTLGAAPVAGLTYQWSPATGLSSATAANPTVTLTNTTGSPITTTYTLTVTGPGNCTNTGTVDVTVNPIPVAVPGANVTFCSGSSGTLGAPAVSGLTYQWSPATGLSSATAANPTVTLTNTTSAPVTTTYTLTVTGPGNCTSTGTVDVTVNPLPVVTPGANVAFCSGGSGTLGAAPVAGNTYSWSPATGLSSATAANPTVTLTNTTSAPVTTTYTLTVTGPGNCTNTGTVDVTVNPIPVAATGSNLAICSGSSGTLGAAPVAGITYQWSPATGLSSATVANPTVTLTNTTSAPITTTYTLTVTGTGNCVNTGTVDVTVNPLPVAVPGANVAFCSGGSATLGAPAVAGLTYQWSPTTGLSSATAANPTVTLTNTTGAVVTTTYTLTVTGPGNCTSTGTVDVTVNPIPVAATGSNVAFCSGGSATLGAAPVAGITYQWSPATGLNSTTAANPTVTLTNTTGAPITTTYTLTVNSAAGCTNTGTVDVTVNPIPVVTPGANVAFCSGGSGTLGAPAVAGLTYSWSPATGLSSATAANPTVTLTNATNAPVTTTYTLTVTNAATSCASTGTVDVTVNPLPVAMPGANVTICSGGTAQLGAPAVPGYTYAWSISTGLSSATAANPTVTLTNTTGAVTTLTYTLTVTNTATFCTNTGTVVVTVNSVVTPGTIGSDQTVCPGSQPAALTSVTGAGGGTGSYAYEWESSLDGVNWAPIVPSATGATYTPGPITVPMFFRRRVTSGPCGTDVSNVVKLSLQQLLVSDVKLAPLPAQCPGVSITFTPIPTNAGVAPTYVWSVNGVQVATTPTYTSSTLKQGDQVMVQLTPTVGFCASGPATATVTINLLPVLPPAVTMSAKTLMPVCSGQPISFSVDNVLNAPAPQYQWQIDGVNVPGANAPTFTASNLSNGQIVTLVLRAPSSCGELATISNSVPVQVNLTADVEAGPDKEIMEGDEVTLEGTANGTYPVTWTPMYNLTFPTINHLRPLVAPTVTTVYTVSGGGSQCGDASSVTVTVTPRLTIPSAFSPNGDGRDDTWQIDNIEGYTNSKVIIFNRWGNKLFEAANYNRSNEWNGTYNGQPVPVGTYYFVVTLPNGKAYTGPLTIIY